MRKVLLWLAAVAIAVGIYGVVHWHGRRHNERKLATVASGLPAALPTAPDLSLTDLNGAALRTSNYKGKVVLVNFWAAWCTPCAEEVPQFMALQKKYQDHGLQVIGFSVEDDPAELRDFYRKYQMNYPVIPSNLKIADAFGGVLGLPTTFLIGRDNLIHEKHNGVTDFSALRQEVVALLHAP
jgi:peroxiredoxin